MASELRQYYTKQLATCNFYQAGRPRRTIVSVKESALDGYRIAPEIPRAALHCMNVRGLLFAPSANTIERQTDLDGYIREQLDLLKYFPPSTLTSSLDAGRHLPFLFSPSSSHRRWPLISISFFSQNNNQSSPFLFSMPLSNKVAVTLFGLVGALALVGAAPVISQQKPMDVGVATLPFNDHLELIDEHGKLHGEYRGILLSL